MSYPSNCIHCGAVGDVGHKGWCPDNKDQSDGGTELEPGED